MTMPEAATHAPTAKHAMDDITVVCVTFNSSGRVAAMGRTLAQFQHVIVVDNGSSDGTAGNIQQALPQATVLANASNLGFGAANNQAIELAQTPFVLLLNPDCELTQRDAMTLLECARRFPEASLVAPQLINRSGKPDLNYTWVPTLWPGRGPGADAPTCVGFVSGACMLIRTSMMRSIAGFDERFFLYYEDTDLCIRLLASCGPIIIEPAAKATHLNRASTQGLWRFKSEYKRGFHHIQSKFIFDQIHSARQAKPATRFRYAVVALIEGLVRLCIMDFARAIRVLGRFFGALSYKPAKDKN